MISIMVILLSGCGGTINPQSMENAIKLCEPNGGLKFIWVYNRQTVECNNGAEYAYEHWVIK